MDREEVVIIEGEECVRVSLLLKKKYIDFLKEYGEWIGFTEQNEFLRETIECAIESTIHSMIDEASVIAPLKMQEFEKKYGLKRAIK